MLRLPARLLDLDTAQRHCTIDTVSCWASRGHVILCAASEEERRVLRRGREGALASILPVHAKVMSGDLRPLYLLWLVGVQAEQLDGDELERRCRRGCAR